jgi:hypothetical protein
MNAHTPITPDLSPDPSGNRVHAQSLAEQFDAEFAAMSERHLGQLQELAEVGMALARAVGRRVVVIDAEPVGEADETSAAQSAELGELGQTFYRITRAVRLVMTLEAKVRDVRRLHLLGLMAQAEAKREAAAKAEEKRKERVRLFFGCKIDEVARARVLARNGMTLAEFEADEVELCEEDDEEILEASLAAERILQEHKSYRDFEARAKSAVLADLCRDLELGSPDWSVWADEEWAIEEAQSFEGSPFVGLAVRETGPP